MDSAEQDKQLVVNGPKHVRQDELHVSHALVDLSTYWFELHGLMQVMFTESVINGLMQTTEHSPLGSKYKFAMQVKQSW